MERRADAGRHHCLLHPCGASHHRWASEAPTSVSSTTAQNRQQSRKQAGENTESSEDLLDPLLRQNGPDWELITIPPDSHLEGEPAEQGVNSTQAEPEAEPVSEPQEGCKGTERQTAMGAEWPGPEGPTSGRLPNVHYRSISMEDVRQHHTFCALPPVDRLSFAGPECYRHVPSKQLRPLHFHAR